MIPYVMPHLLTLPFLLIPCSFSVHHELAQVFCNVILLTNSFFMLQVMEGNLRNQGERGLAVTLLAKIFPKFYMNDKWGENMGTFGLCLIPLPQNSEFIHKSTILICIEPK